MAGKAVPARLVPGAGPTTIPSADQLAIIPNISALDTVRAKPALIQPSRIPKECGALPNPPAPDGHLEGPGGERDAADTPCHLSTLIPYETLDFAPPKNPSTSDGMKAGRKSWSTAPNFGVFMIVKPVRESFTRGRTKNPKETVHAHRTPFHDC